jgi:plasmid stabilization system protein ParE
MNFRLLRPAWRELREASRYYEQRVPGLGLDFLQEVRATIRRILMHPQAWAALDEEIRRCRAHRFPYGIIYTIERDGVLIISVMHLHRRPESWRRNLP